MFGLFYGVRSAFDKCIHPLFSPSIRSFRASDSALELRHDIPCQKLVTSQNILSRCPVNSLYQESSKPSTFFCQLVYSVHTILGTSDYPVAIVRHPIDQLIVWAVKYGGTSISTFCISPQEVDRACPDFVPGLLSCIGNVNRDSEPPICLLYTSPSPRD